MERKLRMSPLLLAAALTGFASHAIASTQSSPGVGMGETSQQITQRGVGPEGADSSNVTLGGAEIIVGRVKKIEGNGFVVQGNQGRSVSLQSTNMVCSSGSQTKMEDMQGQAEIPISPANEDTMKNHNPSRLEACNFKPGDLVRIEASDAERMTTITRLASEDQVRSQIATEKEELSTSAQ
jgi:hypothetical protein